MTLRPNVLSYTALEKIGVSRPKDRLAELVKYAHAKRVLDLGALDETAWLTKRGTSDWLHARLCLVASNVVGVDNSELVPLEGIRTAENGRIIRADIMQLAPIIEQFGRPDLIVAGELIEHLQSTLDFLKALKRNSTLSGVTFVFSTPNACCWHNVLVGLRNHESMHRDHLQVYSYKTIRTLFERAEIELLSLTPTYARFPDMVIASSGFSRLVVQGFQKTINSVEWIAPILSAGWVGVARI